MENLCYRQHIKRVKSDDTERINNLQSKPTYTGTKSCANFGCLEFENQSVIFKGTNLSNDFVS